MPEEEGASPSISLQLGEHQREEDEQVPSCMKIRAFLRLKSIGVRGGVAMCWPEVGCLLQLLSKLFLETESLADWDREAGQQYPGILLSLCGQS